MNQSTKDSKSKNTKDSSVEAVGAASELGINYISHADGVRFNHIITALKQTQDIHEENKLKRQLISCFIEILYKNVMPYSYNYAEELKDENQIILNILNYIHKQLINTKEKRNFIKNKYPDLINALIDILLNYESKLSSEYMIAIVLQREAFLALRKELTDKYNTLTATNDSMITDDVRKIEEELLNLNQNPEYPYSAYIEEFLKNKIHKFKKNDNLIEKSSKTTMAPPQAMTSQNTPKRQAQQKILARRLPVNNTPQEDNENNVHIAKIKQNMEELKTNIFLLKETHEPLSLIYLHDGVTTNLINIYKTFSLINNNDIYYQQFSKLKDNLVEMQKNDYFYLTLEKCIEEYNKNSDNINIFQECFLYYIELIINFTKLEQYTQNSATQYSSEIDEVTHYLLELNSKYPNAFSLHISINEQIQTIINTNSTIQNMKVSKQSLNNSSEVTIIEIDKSITELQELVDSFQKIDDIEIERIRPEIAESINQMQVVVNNFAMASDIKKSYLSILQYLRERVENYIISDHSHNIRPLDEDDFVKLPNTEEIIVSHNINIDDLLTQAEILAIQLKQATDENEKRIISGYIANVQTQINLLLNGEQSAKSSSSIANRTHKKRDKDFKSGEIEIIFDDSDNVSRSPSPLILTQFIQTRPSCISNDTTSVESPKKKRMR